MDKEMYINREGEREREIYIYVIVYSQKHYKPCLEISRKNAQTRNHNRPVLPYIILFSAGMNPNKQLEISKEIQKQTDKQGNIVLIYSRWWHHKNKR